MSPESDRVDCLDARNSPRLKVTSKLPSSDFHLSLIPSLLLPRSGRFFFACSHPPLSLSLSPSHSSHSQPLSFHASTPDSKERTLLDRKISDRRNCSAGKKLPHGLGKKCRPRPSLSCRHTFSYLREYGIP